MPQTPTMIRLLSPEVIARIKAAEVVQRPTAAVKELVENSLDAGATLINVHVSADCLQQIRVEDNGCGISNLELAVQRHATSKLNSVEDLHALHSLGFRGEALASLVQAAGKVHIVSRTAESPVAYQQTFSSAKQRKKAAPTPCARKPGTTIAVHDLFATMKQRQKMTTDYNVILQMLQNYAVLYASRGVALVCQKLQRPNPDLNTSAIVKKLQTGETNNTDSQCTSNPTDQQWLATKEALAQIHGSEYMHSLQNFVSELKSDPKPKSVTPPNSDSLNASLSLLSDMSGFAILPPPPEHIEAKMDVRQEVPTCQCWGLYSSPARQPRHQKPQLTFILFINQRLVECQPLKRRLQELYTNGKQLIFLSLTVPTQHVDVNIHPTKKQVALLFQEEIVEHIHNNLQSRMCNRDFVQSQVATQDTPTPLEKEAKKRKAKNDEGKPKNDEEKENSTSKEPEADEKVTAKAVQNPYKKAPLSTKRVRTSHTTPQGAMEPYLSQQAQQQASTSHSSDCPLALNTGADLTQPGAFAALAQQCTCRNIIVHVPRQAYSRPKKIAHTECSYNSIVELRTEAVRTKDKDLTSQLRTGYLVGIVSSYRSVVQCGENLMLLNHYLAAVEMFYQIALWRFGGGAEIATFPEPLDVARLVQSQLELATNKDDSTSHRKLAEQSAQVLWENAEMLQEYFSMILGQDEDGRIILKGLPILLDNYVPLPQGLPLFLLRMATEVDWSEEKPCFDNVCRELAYFYAELPSDDELKHFIRHTLFPSLSTLLVPSDGFVQNDGMLPLTSLNKLYRVFERC